MILYENERSDKTNYLYHQDNENLHFQRHTHYSFEVIFVFGGELLCEVENTLYTLKEGRALLVLPGQIHSYKTVNYCKSYLCVFSNDLVPSFYAAVKGKKLSSPVFRFSGSRLADILKDDRFNIFIKKSALYEICGTVMEQSSVIEAESTDFILTGIIAFYVQNNFTKDISLKKIADEYGYNYTYLSAFFNKTFKKNFSAYVNEFRLQYAAHLMETSSCTVTDAAYSSGFSTIRNFNSAFKKAYGKPPRQYRRERVF